MTPVSHSVTDNQLHDHVPGIIRAITDVFSYMIFPFSMPLDTFLHTLATFANMADFTGAALFLSKLVSCRGKPV